MRKSILAAALSSLLSATMAYAQEQTQPQPSPEVRSYQKRMRDEINANLSCTAVVLALEDRVKALETELANAKAPKKE